MIDLLIDWFEISCMTTDNFCFYLQNRLIQTSQTAGQWYSDTYPFSIPWWSNSSTSNNQRDKTRVPMPAKIFPQLKVKC
jgi:hypothetical protein